jgi:hypothetical protein
LLIHFSHQALSKVVAHVPAIVLLDHLRRRAALLRDRLDILADGERQAYERVPCTVKIPLTDSFGAQRCVPVSLRHWSGSIGPRFRFLEELAFSNAARLDSLITLRS